MMIDLKKGKGEFEDKCFKCNVELKFIGLPRCNSYVKCPNCKTLLKINFDFIVMNDGDEWDLYEVKLNSENYEHI